MAEKIPLNQGDIHIWYVEPQKIKMPEILAKYRALLPEDEKQRIDRYRFEKDRHDALITRAFVRHTLSRYDNVSPEDWRFEKGEKDKPEVVNANIPIRFNVSHTHELIVCAVMLNEDIGIDVEYTPRNNDILAIADRYFSPLEVKELFSLPEDQQRSRFFDYWTLKESYIKAWGLGLAIPLDDFSFHIGAASQPKINENISLSFASHRIDHPEVWSSWIFYPGKDHRMSLSVRFEKKRDWQLSFIQTTPFISEHRCDNLFQL